jgi:hypothetical protein
MLGPNWERKLRAMADQMAIIQELGLPLGFFETVAGAVVDQTQDEQTTEEQTTK